ATAPIYRMLSAFSASPVLVDSPIRIPVEGGLPTLKTLRGNAVIGQSRGPPMVINQSLFGAIEEAFRHDEIRGIYGAVHGVQGVLNEDLIDLRAESSETLKAVANTPSAALGSVRKKPTAEECKAIFDVFKVHDVRYFFYTGGNDSAETADLINRLAREAGYELRVCHIPKTIDN